MATVHLPSKNILAPYLSGYNSEGNPAPAVLPDALTSRLAGTGTNVNHIILYPTTAIDAELTTCYAKTGNSAATVDSGMTAAITRPLGGSGTATLANLRAVEFLLIADPVSTAEIDAGVTGPRGGYVTVSIVSDSDGEVLLQTTLAVDAASGADRLCRIFSAAEPIGVNATIRVSSVSWVPKVKLHILTVAPS